MTEEAQATSEGGVGSNVGQTDSQLDTGISTGQDSLESEFKVSAKKICDAETDCC